MGITAYKLIEADSAAELKVLVDAEIGGGFQPYGFPLTLLKGTITSLIQPMTQGAPVAQDPTTLQAGIDTVQTNLDDYESAANARLDDLEDEVNNVTVGQSLTAVGTNRATALSLTAKVNNVTTAASGTGVVLDASATVGIGGSQQVINNGENAIKVYAAGSDTVDGTAGATGVSLAAGESITYLVAEAGKWIKVAGF